MITCKEDLLNTYIKNDCGKLRELYLSKAREFGVQWSDFLPAEDSLFVGGVVAINNECKLEGNLSNCGCQKQLTLADFKPKPKTKVEYIPCNFTKASQAVAAFEEDNNAYYFRANDNCKIKSEADSAYHFCKQDVIYRKVGAEVTWLDKANDILDNWRVEDESSIIKANGLYIDGYLPMGALIELSHLVYNENK